MSLITTESFGAFLARNGTYADLTTQAVRDDVAAAATRMGHVSVSGTTCAWVPTPDPVSPDRNALTINHNAVSTSFRARHWIPIPPQTTPIIMGFSLFIPGTFPDQTKQTYPLLTVSSLPADRIPAATTGDLVQFELFNLFQDLRVYRNGVTQSQRTANRGGMSYFEMRIAPNSLRVWMDDALVYEDTTGAGLGGLMFTSWLYTGMQHGPFNRWSIGNIYAVSEDQRAPNVRLGPTTRVISRRPQVDIDVEFLRPPTAESNAAVVAVPIEGSPPKDTLQTETVGARDEYSTPASSAIAGATMVHGAVVRVLAGNLESAPHVIRPWIGSGDMEGADDNQYELVLKNTGRAGTGFTTASCVRQDGTIFIGGWGPSIYYSTDGGDTWQVGFDGIGSSTVYSMAVGPDGTVRAIINGTAANNSMLVCQGTDGPDVWNYETIPWAVTTGASTAVVAVSPTGVWVAVGSVPTTIAIKAGSAAWTTTPLGTGNTASGVSWAQDRFVIAIYVNGGPTKLLHAKNPPVDTWVTTTLVGANTVQFDHWAGCYKRGNRYVFPTRTTATTMTVNTAESLDGPSMPGVPEVSNALVSQYGAGTGGLLPGFAIDNEDVVLVPGIQAVIHVSKDGIFFSTFKITTPEVSVGVQFGKPACNGKDFFIPLKGAPNNSFLMMRRHRPKRDLLNSDGTKLHTNVVTNDPATGLAWTGPAAAAMTIGMTIDS